jgi:hypothetical protein
MTREQIAKALEEVSVDIEDHVTHARGIGDINIIRLDEDSRSRVADVIFAMQTGNKS